MVELEKWSYTQNIVSLWHLDKNLRAGKPDFLKMIGFHRAMLCVTNFLIVLGICEW